MGYLEFRERREKDAEELIARATVADGDIDRIGRAYAAIHFSNGVIVDSGDPTANPPIEPTTRPPTAQEVFQAAVNSFVQIMIANTIRWEQSQAAAAAANAVKPIEVAANN